MTQEAKSPAREAAYRIFNLLTPSANSHLNDDEKLLYGEVSHDEEDEEVISQIEAIIQDLSPASA